MVNSISSTGASRQIDVVEEALVDVQNRLRADANFSIQDAGTAQRKKFAQTFVAVLVREARMHGAHVELKGESCVFASKAPITVDAAATRMLADRVRRRGTQIAIIARHRPDMPQMRQENYRQQTERPIEVAVRKAGRLTGPHHSGRAWDRMKDGDLNTRLSESVARIGVGSESGDEDYSEDWERKGIRRDGRLTPKDDRDGALIRGQQWIEVTEHLLSPVRPRPSGGDPRDNELAARIRHLYMETLGPKIRELELIAGRRWMEVEFGLKPGALDVIKAGDRDGGNP